MAEGTALVEHGTTLRDYLRVVRRRKWIILQAVILVPAVAVALSLRQDKVYKASAEVLLVQQNVANQLNGITDPSAYQQPDRRAQTQADLARVPQVARAALDRAGARDRSSDNFLEHSSATAKTNADLLKLSAWDRNPAMAQRLAQAYADAFSKFRAELDTASYENARQRAQEQLLRIAAESGRDSRAYQDLLSKRDQLEQIIALLTKNAIPVKAADEAVQIQPRPTRNGILGLALGIVLGIGLAFLRETLETRVRGEEEIGERLRLPLLGRLPQPPQKLRSKDKLVMAEDPFGIHAEAYRTLRLNVDFANVDRRARAIMITSASASEGKSTTAANLAIAMALAHKRVVLVDLDLRRPYLRRFFRFAGRPGITDVALGQAELRDAVLSVALGSDKTGAAQANGQGSNGHARGSGVLDVISSGPVPRDGGDFVGSRAVAEIIDQLRAMYDVVLVDAPPLLGVGDAMALSSRVDAVLVLTKLKSLRKSTLSELARVLDAIPAPALGYIVTGVEQGDADSYGYSKHYQYARQGDHVAEQVR